MVCPKSNVSEFIGKQLCVGAHSDRLFRETRFHLPCKPYCIARWKLHHKNAPAHTAFVTRFLAGSKLPTIPQSRYSPVVVPPDFFFFPRLKTSIKGHHFGSVDKVKDACTKVLKDIPEKAYRDAFDAWKFRSKQCIDAGGACFETFWCVP